MTITAALFLVGTELVHTDIADENQAYITSTLRDAGVNVNSVHIVRDDVSLLSDLLSFLRFRVSYIVTAGGLGPTIDDITLEAVARAFSMPLITTEPTSPAVYERMSGSETTLSDLRQYPAESEIISTGHGPVVRTANVYSLPGLPRLVRARLPEVLPRLKRTPIHSCEIFFSLPQSQIAALLEQAQTAHRLVSIGCHPSSNPGEGTTVTLEGTDADEISRCASFLRRSLAGKEATL